MDGSPVVELAPEKGRRAYGNASLCPIVNPKRQPQGTVCVKRESVEHLRRDSHAKDRRGERGFIVKIVL